MFKDKSFVFHVLFALALIGFVLLKLPALGLPYFWDELGVYTRSSMYLAQHGLGLMPADLPADNSRGHPLLFSFVFGAAYKWFGLSVYTGHITALVISLAVLLSVYIMCVKESNGFTGLMVVLLLMAQPLFFALSVMVLPEMMLTLFMLLAVYAYYRKSLWGFAILGSIAIMIKEPAVILPMVVICYSLGLRIVAKRTDFDITPRWLLLTTAPWIVFGVFLVIQKIQNGWFFFPLHAGEISVSASRLVSHFNEIRNFLFFHQGRYWWVKVFLLGALFALIKGRLKPGPSLIYMGMWFVLGFAAFSVLNFYMDRYTMPVFPFLCLFVIACIKAVWDNKIFVAGITALLIAAAVNDMDANRFNYDCDMSYVRLLHVHQRAATYVNEHIPAGERMAINWPLNFILNADETGFKSEKKYESEDSYNAANPPKYIVIAHGEWDFEFPVEEYELVTKIEDGFAWAAIWRRKTD